jgi:hypothetical protein
VTVLRDREEGLSIALSRAAVTPSVRPRPGPEKLGVARSDQQDVLQQLVQPQAV